MAGHEELMAEARAEVVTRRRTRELLRETSEEIVRRGGTFQITEMDDEFARLVYAVVAGRRGSGKASWVWRDEIPSKSGIEFVRLGGLEVFRGRGGFVTDDELRDIAEMPVTWCPPPAPRCPHWWLTLRHPWWAWRGWRDRQRALAREAGGRLLLALIARVLRDAGRRL